MGYTHKSVNKRLKKSVTNRANGAKGGRPPKPKKPNLETQNNPPLEREREGEREGESEREREREGEVEKETDDDANFEANPDSDQIKNPEAEKEKSCAKKENTNDVHAEILKSEESEAWLEAVAMQNRKTTDEIKTRIDDFVKFLTTVDRIHPSKREFLEHFINWLKKNADRPEPQFQNKGSSGVPKFSINQ